ncbi:MAG: polyhydroxyalkanoate synthesis repressor PhaR [Oceanicoccus sp.]
MKLLKKYPNRRIYDTESSQFINLEQVREMVIKRERFKVIHSKTEEDLTRTVLLQIITEQEGEGHQPLLTNRVLEELIRFYGDQMAQVVGPYIEQQIVFFLKEQDKIRQQFQKAFTAPYIKPDKLVKKMVEQYQAFTGKNTNDDNANNDNTEDKGGK